MTSLFTTAVNFLFDSVSNEAERILFDFYLCGTMIVAVVLNLPVLVIVVRFRSSGETKDVIIAFDSVNNVILTTVVQLFALSVLNARYPRPNNVVCQIFGFVNTVSTLFIIHIVGFYSFERCNFLCDPLTYARRFIKVRTAAILSAIYVLAVLIVSVTVLKGGRQFYVTGLSCLANDAGQLVFISVAISTCLR